MSPSDFREALRVFSVACEHDDDAEPLNEQQVDVMAANMNRDADNKVDYEVHREPTRGRACREEKNETTSFFKQGSHSLLFLIF